MSEELYWLGFSVFPGIGPLRFQKLLTGFGSAKNAWRVEEKDLFTILGEALTARSHSGRFFLSKHMPKNCQTKRFRSCF